MDNQEQIKKSFTSSEWVQRVTDYVELEHTITKFERTDIEPSVKTIFDLVDQINACEELDRWVGGERLENVVIPEWAKVFIFPPKVSILPGFDMKDLVLRPAKDETYVYDEAAIIKAAQKIAQTRKTSRKLISAKDARGSEATLSAVQMCIDGRVRQEGKEGFIPVPLISDVDSNLGDWSNEDESKVVSDYFNHSFRMFDSERS